MSTHFGDTPTLMPADVKTGTWERLTADLEARLQRLRIENDAAHPTNDADATAKRRGRIAEILELLAFGREARSQRSELGR